MKRKIVFLTTLISLLLVFFGLTTLVTKPVVQAQGTCEAMKALGILCITTKIECEEGYVAIPNEPECTDCVCEPLHRGVDVECSTSGGSEMDGTKTALGCIPTDYNEFASWLIGRAMGIAGGVAFLLMAWAGFMILTAAGKPEKVQAGKELLTAAISGLLLIIFSIFLLRLIGVKILRIPGLD